MFSFPAKREFINYHIWIKEKKDDEYLLESKPLKTSYIIKDRKMPCLEIIKDFDNLKKVLKDIIPASNIEQGQEAYCINQDEVYDSIRKCHEKKLKNEVIKRFNINKEYIDSDEFENDFHRLVNKEFKDFAYRDEYVDLQKCYGSKLYNSKDEIEKNFDSNSIHSKMGTFYVSYTKRTFVNWEIDYFKNDVIIFEFSCNFEYEFEKHLKEMLIEAYCNYPEIELNVKLDDDFRSKGENFKNLNIEKLSILLNKYKFKNILIFRKRKFSDVVINELTELVKTNLKDVSFYSTDVAAKVICETEAYFKGLTNKIEKKKRKENKENKENNEIIDILYGVVYNILLKEFSEIQNRWNDKNSISRRIFKERNVFKENFKNLSSILCEISYIELRLKAILNSNFKEYAINDATKCVTLEIRSLISKHKDVFDAYATIENKHFQPKEPFEEIFYGFIENKIRSCLEKRKEEVLENFIKAFKSSSECIEVENSEKKASTFFNDFDKLPDEIKKDIPDLLGRFENIKCYEKILDENLFDTIIPNKSVSFEFENNEMQRIIKDIIESLDEREITILRNYMGEQSTV